MGRIEIKKEERGRNGWNFVVGVEGIVFEVTLDDEYWKKLTAGRKEKQELVAKSFEFLLKREPKESILRKFDLRDISKYFPEYEEETKKQLQ